jgi:hypothetical protein
MRISKGDWSAFLHHAGATLTALQVPEPEYDEVVAFLLPMKDDLVEAWTTRGV